MVERYGPWSSALGDGLSPHLSTFWKRRLARLAATRSAQPLPTRRDWLKLSAAGAAACALPTFHLATAEAPDRAKAATSGKIYTSATLKTGAGKDDTAKGLFAVDPETGAWTKVSDFEGRVRVSRDGRTLTLSRSGRTGSDFHEIENVGLWTLDAEGKGEKRRIANFGGATSWSPDGKQLIVAKWLWKPEDDRHRHETWRFNVDGSGAVKLPIPATDEVDDWSPDGQWLVTVSDRHPPHGSGYQLYLMRPDGTEPRRLTTGRGLNVFPRFSPDGRRIAYHHQEQGKDSLWVVDIDGSGAHQVLEQESEKRPPDQVCWSPDGKSLAYILDVWSPPVAGGGPVDIVDIEPQIVLMDDAGKDRRPLERLHARWFNGLDWG